MKPHQLAFLLSLLTVVSHISCAQVVFVRDTTSIIGHFLQVQGGYAGKHNVPFWMRSNQYGSIPLEGASGSVIARSFKEYRQRGEWWSREANEGSLWDWGYGVEARLNGGRKLHAQLIDAHVKVRLAMFEARVGRSKDVMGLNGDTLLTSGNFAVSGNALGVPKVELSIPQYYRLPLFGGLFSFKGTFAHGFMGNYDMNPDVYRVPSDDYQSRTYLHQKSLYGRLGRRDWKLQFYGGFSHQVQWGNAREWSGAGYELNLFETLLYVMTGRAYGGGRIAIPRSKIGNHLGSIDLGGSYDLGGVTLMGYRQQFYDVGALSKLANIRDGLTGLTLTNKNFEKQGADWAWKSILLEFFYSKDQAGYPWSKVTASGDEDYYNNFEYLEGWSYKDHGLGTPFIVPVQSVRPGQARPAKGFFISNRVVAGHLGVSGHIHQWHFLTKLSYARHYGTFWTSGIVSSTGRNSYPAEPIFAPVNQFSFILQAEKAIWNKAVLGGSFALDQGKMFYNGGALLLHVRRSL